MGLIDEKNQRSKISCYCPFKLGLKMIEKMEKKLKLAQMYIS
jgi:hypothetical protein